MTIPRKHSRATAALGFALLMLTACGQADAGAGRAASTTSEQPSDETTASSPPPPILDGVTPVELIGPGLVVDEVAPEFGWDPIAGADTYRLVILTNGEAVWAWQGTATSVRLGGLTADAGSAFPTPELGAGSTWSVAALDAAGNVLAISDHRPVARS